MINSCDKIFVEWELCTVRILCIQNIITVHTAYPSVLVDTAVRVHSNVKATNDPTRFEAMFDALFCSKDGINSRRHIQDSDHTAMAKRGTLPLDPLRPR